MRTENDALYRYILKSGRPVRERDDDRWYEWMSAHSDSEEIRVGFSVVEGSTVSTIFVGFANQAGDCHLWHTLVSGGVMNGSTYRYESRAAAERGHAEVVQRIRSEENARRTNGFRP